MLHLTTWEPYIDSDFPDWFAEGLPQSLAGTLQNVGREAYVHLPSFAYGNIGSLARQCLQLCGQKQPDNLSYYAASNRPARHYHNITELCAGMQGVCGIQLPEVFEHAAMVGGALQYLGYAGVPRETQPISERYLPQLGPTHHRAWLSSYGADQFLRSRDTHPCFRLLVCYIIWCGRGGGETLAEQLHGVQPLRPRGLLGLMSQAARLGGGSEYDFKRLAADHVATNFTEHGTGTPPDSWEELLRRLEFFWDTRVGQSYRALNEAVSAPLTRAIGWDTARNHVLLTIDALQRGQAAHERAVFRQLLQGVGTSFD